MIMDLTAILTASRGPIATHLASFVLGGALGLPLWRDAVSRN